MSVENKSQNEWQKREIGALWKRKSASQSYLSGHIDVSKADAFLGDSKLKFVVFSNRYKEKDSHPDYRVYLSKEDSAQSDETPTKKENVSAPETKEIDNPDEEILV